MINKPYILPLANKVTISYYVMVLVVLHVHNLTAGKLYRFLPFVFLMRLVFICLTVRVIPNVMIVSSIKNDARMNDTLCE